MDFYRHCRQHIAQENSEEISGNFDFKFHDEGPPIIQVCIV